MSFLSCEEMLAAARSQKITLAEAVLRSDLEESRLTEEHSRARHAPPVAGDAGHQPGIRPRAAQPQRPFRRRCRQGGAGVAGRRRLLGGDYLAAVTAEALKTAECNACMKRIVAAPTAGSCGVLPAVLLPLARAGRGRRGRRL